MGASSNNLNAQQQMDEEKKLDAAKQKIETEIICLFGEHLHRLIVRMEHEWNLESKKNPLDLQDISMQSICITEQTNAVAHDLGINRVYELIKLQAMNQPLRPMYLRLRDRDYNSEFSNALDQYDLMYGILENLFESPGNEIGQEFEKFHQEKYQDFFDDLSYTVSRPFSPLDVGFREHIQHLMGGLLQLDNIKPEFKAAYQMEENDLGLTEMHELANTYYEKRVNKIIKDHGADHIHKEKLAVVKKIIDSISLGNMMVTPYVRRQIVDNIIFNKETAATLKQHQKQFSEDEEKLSFRQKLEKKLEPEKSESENLLDELRAISERYNANLTRNQNETWQKILKDYQNKKDSIGLEKMIMILERYRVALIEMENADNKPSEILLGLIEGKKKIINSILEIYNTKSVNTELDAINMLKKINIILNDSTNLNWHPDSKHKNIAATNQEVLNMACGEKKKRYEKFSNKTLTEICAEAISSIMKSHHLPLPLDKQESTITPVYTQ